MHYGVVFLVAQTTSWMQRTQEMRVTALKKYDRHRSTKGECRIIIVAIREGLGVTDEAARIMIAREDQGPEDGGQGGGGEIIEATWKPRVELSASFLTYMMHCCTLKVERRADRSG
jgi:hypothetical protein